MSCFGAILTNLSKAFDFIPNEYLIAAKSRGYGFDRIFEVWF